MRLADSHCHLDRLDLSMYDGQLDLALQAARDVAVSAFLAVAVDLSLDWLVKSIDEGVFKAENLAALAGWLQLELAAKVD